MLQAYAGPTHDDADARQQIRMLMTTDVDCGQWKDDAWRAEQVPAARTDPASCRGESPMMVPAYTSDRPEQLLRESDRAADASIHQAAADQGTPTKLNDAYLAELGNAWSAANIGARPMVAASRSQNEVGRKEPRRSDIPVEICLVAKPGAAQHFRSLDAAAAFLRVTSHRIKIALDTGKPVEGWAGNGF